MFDPLEISSRPLPQAIRDALRDVILDGRIRPGDRLVETEVAEELGISRTPLREALRLLEADGLVQRSTHGGLVVRAFSIEEICEIYDIRELLEGYAARRAAEHITDDQILGLEHNCNRFELLLAKDIDSKELVQHLVELNNEFHRTIADIHSAGTLTDVLSRIRQVPLAYTSFFWYPMQQKAESLESHRAIVGAFKNRDPDLAEQLMRKHLVRGKDFLVQYMSQIFGSSQQRI
jgi:DNA-binding GntR family transcriptional regulator